MRTRRFQSGQVQVSVILVLLVALGVAYVGWTVYPALTDEMEVRHQLHEVANEGWHHRGREELHQKMMDKLGAIGFHWDTPEGGTPTMVPGLGVPDEDVVVTCSDRTEDCSSSEGQVDIRVQYTRVMPFPYLTGKTLTLRFNPHAEAALNAVAW